MESFKGHIVRSLAGHDRGCLYWVVDQVDAYLLLANGKTRKLARPKRKRIRHAEVLDGAMPAIQELMSTGHLSDNQLRRALAAFRDGL